MVDDRYYVNASRKPQRQGVQWQRWGSVLLSLHRSDERWYFDQTRDANLNLLHAQDMERRAKKRDRAATHWIDLPVGSDSLDASRLLTVDLHRSGKLGRASACCLIIFANHLLSPGHNDVHAGLLCVCFHGTRYEHAPRPCCCDIALA